MQGRKKKSRDMRVESEIFLAFFSVWG